jgi:FkbM family methyltransferase
MKYFIDCGGHHGERLKHFVDLYNIDHTWKIYSFEPNKESFNILKGVEYKDCNINPINSGVWTSDGELKFNPETTNPKYGGNNDGEGSTFMSLDNWHIKSANNPGAGDFIDSYIIPVRDLSRFIDELDDKEYLLVKMDIEGSEYPVLKHLIKEKTISKIDDLHVEFHHWAMTTEDHGTTNNLINEIRELGVNIRDWA